MFLRQDILDMILEAKTLKLIEIYYYICKRYDDDLKFYCERFSNNNKPDFTDQEVMTIYLFCIHEEKRFIVKHIHQFAKDYLLSFFPKLISYQAFINRLNRLSNVFQQLLIPILDQNIPVDCFNNQSLLDSMPIITCSGKRNPKVAKELTNKGKCASKGMYYHGLKLHALAFRRPGKLPFAEQLLITPASENDLNVFKDQWAVYTDRTFWGDKIYFNSEFFRNLWQSNKSEMLTPVKAIKGQCVQLKRIDKAANDLYSKAVSSVRQPIEGFFHWLINKTDIQNASNVRSTKGLLTHVFGKMAAAFLFLIF